MRSLLLVALLCQAAALVAQQPPWQAEQSGTTADLRGIHAAGLGVAWASGTHGTVLRTEDGGFEWQGCAMPPGAEELDFRSVWGWDANTALVLSSGPGALSRLYRTDDGCAHWTLLDTNPDQDGFWDGMAFADRNHGYLLGDPVGGKLVLEETYDGGRSWQRVDAPGLEDTTHGAFAASNSSLALRMERPGAIPQVWITTGGPGGALVITQLGKSHAPEGAARRTGRSGKDRGGLSTRFAQQRTPLQGATASQGGFSLALLPGRAGADRAIVVGGDYSRPAERAGTAATWSPHEGWQPSIVMPAGFRSAVVCDKAGPCLAIGPNGTDASVDAGRHWVSVEQAPAEIPKGGEWNALSLPWVVGPHGRIGKLEPEQLRALLAKPSVATRPSVATKPSVATRSSVATRPNRPSTPQ